MCMLSLINKCSHSKCNSHNSHNNSLNSNHHSSLNLTSSPNKCMSLNPNITNNNSSGMRIKVNM